jgi:GT2 family glycosyltransferase
MMSIQLKEYITTTGEVILYNGIPDFDRLEFLSNGYGDLWHSSFEQGYKNAFPEIVYQTIGFYTRDFDGVEEGVSWRVNPNQFAVRKFVWDQLEGFDNEYISIQMKAIDFGYRALLAGAVTLYVNGLFKSNIKDEICIGPKDRHAFFIKKFKLDHALFMIYRIGFWKLSEWNAFYYAWKKFKLKKDTPVLSPRKLNALNGNPKVSYIIPTMMRQEYTIQLLNDLSSQSYKPTQVVIVDATPVDARKVELYQFSDFPFEIILKWQETKGSCRARNEAIDLCTGDYLIFGDDDIRIPKDYIENHLRFLQTYNASACNGLDVRADNETQNLDVLYTKLNHMGKDRYTSGVSLFFNNANNCVKREYVNKLVGNDINYDGGYGEDSDFGLSLIKLGITVLQNPFAANLHLKPATGGYRFWGNQASIIGKNRKKQPWELDIPVKWIRPLPSPTVIYFYLKHFDPKLLSEYRSKYMVSYLFKDSIWLLPIRFIKLPLRQLQFNKAIFYADKLVQLGKRTK